MHPTYFKAIPLFRYHWHFIILLLITVLALIWVSPKFIKMHDEGMLASSAMMMAAGKALYSEVFEFWPPLSLYLTTVVFKFFGVSLLSLRLLAALLILANFTWFYVVLRKMRQGRVFEIGSLVSFIIFSVVFVGMSHHLVGILFLLTCLYALLMFLETHSRWWAALSGLLAGLGLLSMQFEGAVAIALCGFALLLNRWKYRHGTLTNLGFLSVGFLIPIGLMAGYYLFTGSFNQFFYATVIFPLSQYVEVNNSLNPAVLALQLFMTIAIGWWWARQRSSEAVYVLVACCILLLLAILFTNNHSLLVRFSFFTNTIWLGAFIALIRYYKQKPASFFTISAENMKPLLVAVLLLCFVIFPGNLRIMLETAASWRNILLAVHKVETPAGIIYARDKQATKAQEIIDYVLENVDEREPVYFGPYSGHYSFLANRVSPIGYSQLTPGYNPDWMFEDAVQGLRESKVKHIVLLPQESSFAFTADNDLSKYIIENYTIVKPLPHVTLLSAKSMYQYTYKQQLQNRPTDAIWRLREE